MTDKSIRLQEQEDALFAEWKASPDFPKDGKFIRDGIIADMDHPVICFLHTRRNNQLLTKKYSGT